jgi:hypothetical protein
VYSSNSGTSGSCVAKSSTSFNCGNISRSSQCEPGAGINSLSGSCTWIYSSSNEGDNSGNCVAKSDQVISCEDINRASQCSSGGGITALSGNCGLYSNVCKTLCAFVNKIVCESSSRSGDCFYLERNQTYFSGGCVEKV